MVCAVTNVSEVGTEPIASYIWALEGFPHIIDEFANVGIVAENRGLAGYFAG